MQNALYTVQIRSDQTMVITVLCTQYRTSLHCRDGRDRGKRLQAAAEAEAAPAPGLAVPTGPSVAPYFPASHSVWPMFSENSARKAEPEGTEYPVSSRQTNKVSPSFRI